MACLFTEADYPVSAVCSAVPDKPCLVIGWHNFSGSGRSGGSWESGFSLSVGRLLENLNPTGVPVCNCGQCVSRDAKVHEALELYAELKNIKDHQGEALSYCTFRPVFYSHFKVVLKKFSRAHVINGRSFVAVVHHDKIATLMGQMYREVVTRLAEYCVFESAALDDLGIQVGPNVPVCVSDEQSLQLIAFIDKHKHLL